jgi:hypothetical protein
MQLTLLLATGIPAAVVATASSILARGVDCSFETSADFGVTCDDFASNWGLSLDELKKLNPGITCPNMDTNLSYCVIGEVTNAPTPSSTKGPSTTPKPTSSKLSTTLKTSTKTSAASPSKPTNTMPGLAANCDGWDKVVSNDNCDTIAKRNSLGTTQFKSYNSELDTSTFSTPWLAI